MEKESYSKHLFESITNFEDSIRSGIGWVARDDVLESFLKHPSCCWLNEYIDDMNEGFYFALIEDILEKDGIDLLDPDEVEDELRRNVK